MKNLESYVRQWATKKRQEFALRTESLVDQIYNEARDLATASRGLKNAESGLGERTGTFLRSISKRKIVDPFGSISFEVYYDKNICKYAEYIEHGTRKIRPFKIITRAYENILGGGK